MKSSQLKKALAAAKSAAGEAGKLILRNLRSEKKINSKHRHDIKLELDVLCQKRIEGVLRRAFPEIPLLGEEGIVGDPNAAWRWVVDPIDGTVNFTYGIPHSCVSIALQTRTGDVGGGYDFGDGYRSVAAVIYDPFCDEVWTSLAGGGSRLNGTRVAASARTRLADAIVSVGFAKYRQTLEMMLPRFNDLIHRVRKIRIMGAAALDIAYVATGRFDAYMESGIRLWDIAAGALILQEAGGEFWCRPMPGDYTFQMIASNGRLRKALQRDVKKGRRNARES